MKNTISLKNMKYDKEKITMVTAYDYPSAKLVEQANVDMILVGDSLGMVVLGYESTIQVTVDDMIHHGKAVTRGAPNTFVVVDMPFMSYHISLEDSMKQAKRIFQETGAQALKVEGGSPEILTVVQRLTNAGIPIVAHIGLTPQSVNVFGGFKVQGKDQESAEKLIHDAEALQAHGAIACVLECVPKQLAATITSRLTIPTIGIGAGVDCDGQVLVYHDLLQYGVDRLAKFVKTYADVNQVTKHAISEYVADVKANNFPEEKHSYLLDPNTVLPEKMGE
ncbi:3-methyl-2-oxobutanoate hydroxymethyltransferase [Natronobacillus azotifigens]|uniref:3-methyl-2-oxobutanoate hydroxymethyltransferase n=1 Tax=Natronobacillus azotifigens TaxID=472978 RepID=A0A9J6R8C5_9BACI|nr:3-methyl-2-oxobutanoate hydroxymethyltransferase [Natronobacillus azotifigens]MCZ0701877.1 3-methyl-2-oxobutanoate hydroxymethyltransferase [Natronobacillus azotifigens]